MARKKANTVALETNVNEMENNAMENTAVTAEQEFNADIADFVAAFDAVEAPAVVADMVEVPAVVEEIAATDVVVDTAAADLESVMETVVDETAVAGEVIQSPAVVADATEEKARGGRKARYETRENIVADILAVKEGGGLAISRTLRLQLLELGYLKIAELKHAGKEEGKNGRGRPKHLFSLTEMGEAMIALDNVAPVEDIVPVEEVVAVEEVAAVVAE